MSPAARSFLDAVVRYQLLRHLPSVEASAELFDLERRLSDDGHAFHDGVELELENVMRLRGDTRGHQRNRMWIPGSLTRSGVRTPCDVVELGASGLRFIDRFLGEGGLHPGDRLVLTLQPEPHERIDLPLEIVRREGDTLGARFIGPPLRLGRPGQRPAQDPEVLTVDRPLPTDFCDPDSDRDTVPLAA